MKRLYIIILLAIIGCAGKAQIEVGLNDEPAALLGTPGDFGVRVIKIEILQGDEYTTIWEGSNFVQFSLHTTDYNSITDGYVEIAPDTYEKMRLTIDSLVYIITTTSKTLIDSVYQFDAISSVGVAIGEDRELKLVVDIMSDNWFTPDSIMSGHNAFEGARLKIYSY